MDIPVSASTVSALSAKRPAFTAVKSPRTTAIVIGVGDLPARRTAGSPFGMTLKIMNVMTEMANSTATIAMTRLTMKRAISDSQDEPLVLHSDLRPRVERVAHTVAEDVQREH